VYFADFLDHDLVFGMASKNVSDVTCDDGRLSKSKTEKKYQSKISEAPKNPKTEVVYRAKKKTK
jgi:hypothetical protein